MANEATESKYRPIGPHRVEVRGHADESGYTSFITDLHLNLHPGQIDELEWWFEH